MQDEITVTDEMLDSPSQRMIRASVAALPEDSPSLAWRSSLNEQLRSVSPRQRRPRWVAALWAPALGLGLAGALAVVMLVQAPIAPPKGPSSPSGVGVEATLVSVHLQDESTADVVGVGLTPEEASMSAAVRNDSETAPSEVDLESL